jgi:hypothetical protein
MAQHEESIWDNEITRDKGQSIGYIHDEENYDE